MSDARMRAACAAGPIQGFDLATAAACACANLRPVYNVFRYGPGPDLLCAVPEDRPVPTFLDGAIWNYAETLRACSMPPPGFLPAEAELGVRLNGFYLFQKTGGKAARESAGFERPVGSMTWPSGARARHSARLAFSRRPQMRSEAADRQSMPGSAPGEGQTKHGPA